MQEDKMAAAIIFACIILSIIGHASTQEEGCRYNLVIGYCPCTNNTQITQDVQLVIVEGSDGCDCTFKLCHMCSQPSITNIYDRECTWNCVNTTCVWNKEQTTLLTTSSTVKDIKQTKDSNNPVKTSETTTTVTDHDITVEGTIQEMTPTIGLWIWAGVFTLFTALAFLKLYIHLRKQQPQYLPLNRNDTTETTYAPSYLSTTPSRPVIPQQILTPPSISTPLKPSSRSSPSFHSILSYREPSPVSTTSSIPLVPLMFFRDPSPEPSAPPMEDLESSSESTPSSPIASRTRNMIKRKSMMSDTSF
ncbi:unnamed protein product [Mytilus coruscus]|uniref:Uncharacterized protein n=1 Tax=Mytilus coruscus TaxID=42192 RepID=A0A6J8BB42_MYTCO|nr:unnamed protein product [Mytilus coruscus]